MFPLGDLGEIFRDQTHSKTRWFSRFLTHPKKCRARPFFLGGEDVYLNLERHETPVSLIIHSNNNGSQEWDEVSSSATPGTAAACRVQRGGLLASGCRELQGTGPGLALRFYPTTLLLLSRPLRAA